MTMPEKIKTVMIVDDEEVDQLLYKRVMKRSGLVGEIVSFFYADEALEYLRSSDRPTIDVIFLDINMPRMNGFEFLEAAEKLTGAEFSGSVVVMLTTSLDPRDQAKAAKFDIVRAFLNKPLTTDHLVDIATMLDKAAA